MADLTLKDNTPRQEAALLVATYRSAKERELCFDHLNELELLFKTYGGLTKGKEGCSIRGVDAATYLGSGKIEELIILSQQLQVDCIIFDDEISPAQQRNLEKLFNLPVMDRTEVILKVFAQRAHTREAKLQIELAQLQYQIPRLKRLWTHLSRQQGTSGAGGGGAYLKGEGEKQIEIDRRILKRKVNLLQKEIEEVRHSRNVQRVARERAQMPVFALVGYTNAGKSTLMNALTHASVFVEDKLFATLETTTRKLALHNHQEVLLVDTVGFIRKLPHLLVAAFKSTLEEAVEADILLHVIDASHPTAEEQAAATVEVLKELGAGSKLVIPVLNKMDQVADFAKIQRLKMSYPGSILISAQTGEGLQLLEERMIAELQNWSTLLHVRIPQSEYSLVTEIRRIGSILKEDYDENDLILDIEVPPHLAGRLVPYVIKGGAV